MTQVDEQVKQDVEFEGELVRLGKKDYVVPSLSVKQAKVLWPNVLDLDKGVTKENIPEKYAMAIPIIHAALSRNYPDISVDEVEDLVDVKNIRKLLIIVSGQSGMPKVPPAEPVAADVEEVVEP